MQPSDLPRFSKLLSAVMAYYRQDSSEFIQDLFWSACAPFSFEQVSKAFDAHCKDPEHGRFAPKVADLVRVLQGTRTDRAMIAWGKVYEAMGSVGAYSDVVFDDPAIHAVVQDLGGWPKVARTESEELGYLQHRFCEAYRAYVGRGGFDYPRRLPGARDSDEVFRRYGIPLPKPALVGSPEVCRQVYLGGADGGKTAITYTSVEALPAPAGGASE